MWPCLEILRQCDKRVEGKSQKVLELFSTFEEISEEKLVETLFAHHPVGLSKLLFLR